MTKMITCTLRTAVFATVSLRQSHASSIELSMYPSGKSTNYYCESHLDLGRPCSDARSASPPQWHVTSENDAEKNEPSENEGVLARLLVSVYDHRLEIMTSCSVLNAYSKERLRVRRKF